MGIQANGVNRTLSRAVSAEIRGLRGRHNISVRALVARAALDNPSLNYLAERLRDEKPFTLEDVDRIADVFGMSGADLIQQAVENDRRAALPPHVAARDAEVAAEQAARKTSRRDAV